ncbi:Pyrimidine 5'-nucleotidase eukaryotic [Arabidopsis thaliana x Arabidopsis arenosa]|uniref:5'-nucleotidase n=6 Tax=Arabidopsis TaxID=3701 RepID=F4ITW1_ARATH|nr:5'-nucleotidase / magnesium ion binding protein [Arabidopsis thaliana]AEC09569.2 5'-nucleotidase / magnesium ion binding protein [Arabidopsis thaliana]KAG7638982.1 Pyrimidine 5'-nucleotidase eukaryotic [Arabidopsis thaliana x Arabidopsis arenosa]KAG7643581.1 Pyrimidine 5'-nucleotidase eukaryotic [Arabidopsis suecica]|eukprot:NP_001318374.1 5'-nucleotidase / magnesium ion binding protein [Arabidopsis thaliana]
MRVISFCTRFHAPSSIRFSIVCHNHPQTHSSCYFRHDNHQMEPCELSANTVIAHPRALTDKMTLIRDAGPSKFQVIADFDATLTRYRVNGLRGRQTSHGLLQQGDAYYDAKRQALYDHYHPLEISPVIPIDEKTKLMEEWWGKTHELLIEGGLTYDAIKKSVANSSIAFREGVSELFEFLEKKEIPVLIFSAGLADVIEEVLRQNLDRTFKNVKIVSNRMVFNDDGQLVSFKGKLIHVLNKNEHALDMAAPLHDRLGVDIGEEDEENVNMKERRNVLLMGDHLGDLRMSDGLDYETRISIGFLNDNIEKSLESYRESFDLVYLNDAPMWGALELVSRLFSTEAS